MFSSFFLCAHTNQQVVVVGFPHVFHICGKLKRTAVADTVHLIFPDGGLSISLKLTDSVRLARQRWAAICLDVYEGD